MKNCRRCGAELEDWMPICGICGTPAFRMREESAGQERAVMRAKRLWSLKDSEEYKQEIFSRLSMFTAILSCILLMIPRAALPVSMMAILFGAVSIRREWDPQNRQNTGIPGRAVTGIVIGVVIFLFAAVLSFCMTALGPYSEDLRLLMEEYMSRMLR